MARHNGTGSIYYVDRKNAWVAAYTIPTQRGEPRRRASIVGKTFCSVLQRFSEALPLAEHDELTHHERRSRDMAAARALGTHTTSEWVTHVRTVGRACEYCGSKVSVLLRNWTMDHRIPISRGGSDSIGNLALCCTGCNSAKGTLTAEEFKAWRSAHA